MLLEPLCDPSDTDIFYHYCDAHTFKIICEDRTIRFSDANMMNDSAELTWGRETLTEAGALLTKLRETVPELGGVNVEFFLSVAMAYEEAKRHLHPFIAAFSRQPDVLSQWRAYADNGRGFCIGVSGKILKDLPASLFNVVYNRDDQLRQARDALGMLYFAFNEGEDKKSFIEMAGSLTGSLLAFKNPQFSEEQEIRCVHLVDIDDRGQGSVFVDEGGHGPEGEVGGEDIKYRIRDGQLVAYFDLPLTRNKSLSPIKQIWLGPKNPNKDFDLSLYLNSIGHTGVEVHRSKATYR